MVNAHNLTPANAWMPLPKAEWNEPAGRHLAARLGYSLQPELIGAFQNGGPEASLRLAFDRIHPMPRPELLMGMMEEMEEAKMELRNADEKEKRELRQSLRKLNRESYTDFGFQWLCFARDPARSYQEKLALFIENVWVVAFSGVRSTPALLDYQERVRRSLGGTYPDLCKTLAESPAMVRYLNLNQNHKGSPNENFARELFELFCLGEGNYTENDIKEAARALTGYVVGPDDEVKFVRKRHDSSKKTIFGETGNFGLKDVIDLIFRQPAAARFLPQELARAYLTEEGLPDEFIQPLADEWKSSGFKIPFLLTKFFSSRIFFEQRFRGNMIKSPIHFYLGLLQDLDLDVFPSPRLTTNSIRTMGQAFFNPPNVRGWVGGRSWINSATLTARSQLVNSVFHRQPMSKLNADEKAALEKAVKEDRARFRVDSQWMTQLGNKELNEISATLCKRLYVQTDPTNLEALIKETLAPKARGPGRGAACLKAALTHPAYHLC